MRYINYQSDFDFILTLKDCSGKDIGFPEYDWVARLYTINREQAYIASSIGGVLTNCYDDEGKIHIVLDNHGLASGSLRVEIGQYIPNEKFPDQSELIVTPQGTDIELIRGAAPCPCKAEVELILPTIKGDKGDKGDPLTYEDLTEEQIAELQKPATEAAEKLKDYFENPDNFLSVTDAEAMFNEVYKQV